MTNSARTRGIHHVGLTVPDLQAARTFFTEALGFQQVGEVPDYPAAFVSDGSVMLTLWQAKDPPRAVPFDRKNGIGLHHLAFQIATDTTLETLHAELSLRTDVSVEFAPEALGKSATRHMMLRIPGNIRLELIAPG